MDTYSNQIVDYLKAQSWQIATLVAVIAVVAWALRNRSAHVRYLLWLIVLAKCLMPPLVEVPVALLPPEKSPEPLSLSTAHMRSIGFEDVEAPNTQAPGAMGPSVSARPSPLMSKRMPRFTFRQWLALGWIIGVSLFIFIALTKAFRIEFRLRRRRKILPSKLQSEIEGLFSEFNIENQPKVWLIEGIGQPFVWGLLRGSIYLPANFVKVNSAEYRRGILGHELSHVLRFDAAVNLLQIAVQAVFWFHPLVWWANRKIRAEREKCCDEIAIVRLGTKAKDYSDAIVTILVSEYESDWPIPLFAVAGSVKSIEERINTIMKPERRFYNRPSLTTAIVVFMLALLTAPTSLVLSAQGKRVITESNKELTLKSTEAAGTAYNYAPVSDPNLVAWWRFDDGSGSRAKDSSRNGSHGTLYGDTKWTTGRIGGALDFDGDGDYVDCGNPEIFNFKGQMTVGVWVNLRSIPNEWRTVVAKGQDGWRLALTRRMPSYNFSVAGRAFAYPTAYCATQVAFGEWHHVCGTYDGQEIHIFLDGQIDAAQSHGHGIATNDAHMLIGDNPQATGRFWNGLIDEVCIFNRALSVDEIRGVMQGLSDPSATKGLRPAGQILSNSIGMELAWVPPGEFMMGGELPPIQVTVRYNGDPVRYENEHPQRKVLLTRGFWISQSEVTQEQYEAIMGSNPSHFKGENLPVEMVSWHDAMEFCRKLSQKEGRTYILPTEAQWEYAARAGTNTAYCFGDDPSQLGEFAWYRGDTGSRTHPVKMKKPNAFGLYDMHGNVWEWCLDWYQNNYNELGHVDPLGPRSGQCRVVRGGSWHAYAGPYRSAVRDGYNPDARNRYLDIGFRVVLLIDGAD